MCVITAYTSFGALHKKDKTGFYGFTKSEMLFFCCQSWGCFYEGRKRCDDDSLANNLSLGMFFC